MSDTAVAPVATDQNDTETDESQLVVQDLLVEDVSIDGMCGVY
ncbi:mycofactocin precursor [Nakamurella sp. YIM 132087]|uniref:Mycofactocin n=1 Tax=Nakamurella alba TaxID=2665158 RepID=A0A7K1FMU1_9ACTN|nr:mycofactocin precursor MftA [Nakamurella alba]MTD15487.1 mycofactocin precursor [Nakamurella alba]